MFNADIFWQPIPYAIPYAFVITSITFWIRSYEDNAYIMQLTFTHTNGILC